MISRRLTCATIFSRSSAPPPAFDQIHLRVHFIGTVDRQVEVFGQVVRQHGDAELDGFLCRGPRGREGNKVLSSPLCSNSAIRRVAKMPVLPVPSPTFIPDWTNCTARLAACSLNCAFGSDELEV